MKKIIITVLAVLSIASAATKGGCAPCLATCCFGPRVGVEMNEGTQIRSAEWIGLVANTLISYSGKLYLSIDPATGKSMNDIKTKENLGGPQINAKAPESKGGFAPFLTSCCLGPRVALEANDGRKIRTMEWLTLVPVINIIPVTVMLYESYSGKTMSEIAAEEGLDS